MTLNPEIIKAVWQNDNQRALDKTHGYAQGLKDVYELALAMSEMTSFRMMLEVKMLEAEKTLAITPVQYNPNAKVHK